MDSCILGLPTDPGKLDQIWTIVTGLGVTAAILGGILAALGWNREPRRDGVTPGPGCSAAPATDAAILASCEPKALR
jgi:hypothetical protein